MQQLCNNIPILLKVNTQRENANGFPIIIHISHNKQRKNISTGFYTTLKEWNEKITEPRKTHPQYRELMAYVIDTKKAINDLGNLKKYQSAQEVADFIFPPIENGGGFINNHLHFREWDEFTFFHYDREIITKHVLDHDVENRKVLVHSYNPDKSTYPDEWIDLNDCYIVCNVIEVTRPRGYKKRLKKLNGNR